MTSETSPEAPPLYPPFDHHSFTPEQAYNLSFGFHNLRNASGGWETYNALIDITMTLASLSAPLGLSASLVNGMTDLMDVFVKQREGTLEPGDITGLAADALGFIMAGAIIFGGPVGWGAMGMSMALSMLLQSSFLNKLLKDVRDFPWSDWFKDLTEDTVIEDTLDFPWRDWFKDIWDQDSLSDEDLARIIREFEEQMGGVIDDERLKRFFDDAQNFTRPVGPVARDPLALDLDGDGLETTRFSLANPIWFDHDLNGSAEGTGWLQGDDGFLVFDRNGNGLIDDGSELFGDHTPLNGGGYAANGFAALAQEDSNGDGIVNAQDANWNNLKIWRDLNQDGVSQSNELFTLNQIGIAGINVASNGTGNAQNGNQIGATGTFIWEDGHEGTIGGAGQMADIDFSVDTFHSHFTDTTRAFPAYFAQTFIPVQTYASRGC